MGKMDEDEYIQVLITIDEKEKAEEIAEDLVEERLAACVQIAGPIESTYRWEGNVQRTEEYMCIAKSEKNLYAKLERTVKEIHPYEDPEIIAASTKPDLARERTAPRLTWAYNIQ